MESCVVSFSSLKPPRVQLGLFFSLTGRRARAGYDVFGRVSQSVSFDRGPITLKIQRTEGSGPRRTQPSSADQARHSQH